MASCTEASFFSRSGWSSAPATTGPASPAQNIDKGTAGLVRPPGCLLLTSVVAGSAGRITANRGSRIFARHIVKESSYSHRLQPFLVCTAESRVSTLLSLRRQADSTVSRLVCMLRFQTRRSPAARQLCSLQAASLSLLVSSKSSGVCR